MNRILCKIELFWDDQDPTSPGWAYRLHYADGHQEDNPHDGEEDATLKELLDLEDLPCGNLPDDVWPETLDWRPLQGAKGWAADVAA